MNNQQGIAILAVILLIVLVGLVGATGWYVYSSNKNTNKSLTNAQKAANSIVDSSKNSTAATKASPSPNPTIDKTVINEKPKSELLAFIGSTSGCSKPNINIGKYTKNNWAEASVTCPEGGGYIGIYKLTYNKWVAVTRYQSGPFCAMIEGQNSSGIKISKELLPYCILNNGEKETYQTERLSKEQMEAEGFNYDLYKDESIAINPNN